MEMKGAFSVEIPEEAAQWLGETLGPFEVVGCCRGESSRTGVWKVKSRNGTHYLKLNGRRVRWATELYVYQNWATVFTPFAPELQGVLDKGGQVGLLLGALEGVPLREVTIAPAQEVKTYAMAGELLARLSTCQTGSWFGQMDEQGRAVSFAGELLEEPVRDPRSYYRDLISGSIQGAEAAAALIPYERRIAESVLYSLESIVFPQPVPTSLDYTPGNWIVDSNGNFRGLIDFENMLWVFPSIPLCDSWSTISRSIATPRKHSTVATGAEHQRNIATRFVSGASSTH